MSTEWFHLGIAVVFDGEETHRLVILDGPAEDLEAVKSRLVDSIEPPRPGERKARLLLPRSGVIEGITIERYQRVRYGDGDVEHVFDDDFFHDYDVKKGVWS